MKLNKLLLTTSLVPIAVIPAMVSCNKQPTKTEYELIFDEELDGFRPEECVPTTESTVKTITLLANINYTFTANVTGDREVQGFMFYDSTTEFINFKDLYTKLVVKQDGNDITTQGEYRADNSWFFIKGEGRQLQGKIEVSITFNKTIDCIPVFSNDV